MEKRIIKKEDLDAFAAYLRNEERSDSTVEKYLRDVGNFFVAYKDCEITKQLVIAYKSLLMNKKYAVNSVNSMLASVNSFLSFCGWYDCRVKMIKCQKDPYLSEERELTKGEYIKLISTAKGNGKNKLSILLQTIAGTGIRISELKFITVEAAKFGYTVVECKGKMRRIYIAKKLQKKLLRFASEHGIKSGMIFVTRSGNPIDRSNVWRAMKMLCRLAGVDDRKVFPHNLRHLFAGMFYGLEKDIAKLADILGHSSINTTRIYVKTSGKEHRKILDNICLLL